MARRKHVKRIDPRYFLNETVNRGEEEKEPGVGGQPPEWERKLAKSEPKVARSKRRHVRRLEDPDVDVEELEEGCPLEDEGEAIDMSGPGMELHVDDISQLSPEEAFAAGMAAARDAIDQAMGGPDGPPPEGGFSGGDPMGEPAMQEAALEDLEEIVSDEEGTEELKPFKHKKGPMAAKRRWAIERARKQKAGEPLGKHAEKWGVTHKNEAAVRKGEEE